MKKLSKKARPVETIFDLIEIQDSCIRYLAEKEKFKDREEWLEAFRTITEATKGFISDDTLQLLLIMDEYGLYRFKRYVLKLRQKLMRDFNTLRQIYVQKGLLQVEEFKPLTTMQIPREYPFRRRGVENE
mgnify:CR=1 FL=1